PGQACLGPRPARQRARRPGERAGGIQPPARCAARRHHPAEHRHLHGQSPLRSGAGRAGRGAGAAGRSGAATHRPGGGAGAPARRPGGAGEGAARPGGTQPRLDPHHRPARRLDHPAPHRERQSRAVGPVDLLHRDTGGLGHGQFQGDPARPDAAGAARRRRGGRLSEPQAERPCRQHPARLGRAVRGTAAGERHRQFRQDRAPRAGQDRHRPRSAARHAAAARHLGDADRASQMSGGTLEQRDASWRPRGNPWLIAVVVTLAAFMEVLDTTIVNVSLPHIAGTVGASYDEATWTLTSYLIANGIVLPISGWLGRLIGRKRYFLICIAMFTACSFLCGMASSLGEMIIFRLMQGFFGGGLQPNQQSIILDTFEPSQRGRAFSIVAVAVIVAPIIGPTLGGWITDNYSWRWIFLINVPVGVFTFFAVARLVEDPPWVVREHKQGDKRVDYIGLGLIALGLGCLEVMLDRGEDRDWFGSPSIVMFGFLAFAGITGAIGWLLYPDKPVVNLRVYADRNFAVGSLVIFAIGAILYSSAVLIPQLAQQHFGYTALLAGLLLSPGALLVVLLIPIVAKVLLPHVQTRYIIAFGFFSLGCALLYAHRLTPDADFMTLAIIRAAQTFGL